MDEKRVLHIGEASTLPTGIRWGDVKDMTGEPLGAASAPAVGPGARSSRP